MDDDTPSRKDKGKGEAREKVKDKTKDKSKAKTKDKEKDKSKNKDKKKSKKSKKSKSKSKSKDKKKNKRVVKLEKPLGMARVYADVNYGFPNSRFDVEGYRLKWGTFQNYKLHEMVGQGAYGEVYRATNVRTRSTCVVKTIRPEKEEKIKIQREVKMLHLMQGGPNIVKLLDLVRDANTKLKMLVFEYVDNPDFRRVYASWSDLDARHYLFQLLRALNYTHSQGVIHRDLKPRNVLYNPETRELRLIDWGFGEFYWPHKPIAKWPGTRYYKAPELFLHYEHYDYSVDMWSFGCMLASIAFQRVPMFRGKDDSMSQMQAICKYLGSDDLEVYMTKYHMPLRHKYRKGIMRRKKEDWRNLVTSKNKRWATPEALDLISKLLVWDHEKRLTVVEALAHPYFDPVRDLESGSTYSYYYEDEEPEGEESGEISEAAEQGGLSSAAYDYTDGDR